MVGGKEHNESKPKTTTKEGNIPLIPDLSKTKLRVLEAS